jgi:thymidylate synthase (FAD)
MEYIYDDAIGGVELVATMGNDATPAHSARVSFAKLSHSDELNERDEKLIKFLANHQHTSPFEHITATFLLTVPLFVRSQIQRHRTFSYNEVSRRYTSERIQFYSPIVINKQAQLNLQCSSDEEVHHPEDVREIIDSISKLTGNLLNWSKFLKLRCDQHAQLETRLVASAIKELLLERFPVSLGSLL